MKKHFSVFGLFARSSVYKVLLILITMCAVECALFMGKLHRSIDVAEALDVYSSVRLETLIDNSGIKWCFAIAFVFITVILCRAGTEYHSKCGYTLNRLSIGPRYVFLYQAAYNLLIYLLLWATQAALTLALCYYYVMKSPIEIVGNQTVFLAFYRNNFLHSLIPLSEVFPWIRNDILVLSLSIAAALFPYNQRRKKFSFSILALSFYAVVFFSQEIGFGARTLSMILVGAMIIGEMLYTLFIQEENYDS